MNRTRKKTPNVLQKKKAGGLGENRANRGFGITGPTKKILAVWMVWHTQRDKERLVGKPPRGHDEELT